MAFLDSDTIRPVYDVHDGGPPVGFRCMLQGPTIKEAPSRHWVCERLFPTMRGMRQHQRLAHKVKPQADLVFGPVRPTR